MADRSWHLHLRLSSLTFLAGISAADLSSFTSDVSAFLHPSLYACLRCLPLLQAGHDAYEGLIAVKLWFGFRTELANIMMSKTLWFEVLTGSENRFRPNKGQVKESPSRQLEYALWTCEGS